jgi:glucuronokinase
MTFDAFSAGVSVEESVEPGVRFDGSEGLCALLRAGLAAADEVGLGLEPFQGFEVSVQTDIPRQVGLSGSSAVIVALLRALESLTGRVVSPGELAACAWRAEAQGLKIRCGPLDRAIQVVEGLCAFDFAHALPALSMTRLEPGLLPELFLAWDKGGGEPSGAVHAAVRARFDSGDQGVKAAVEKAARCADRGLVLFRSEISRCALADLFDDNFAARASAFPIDRRDRAMVKIGRALGAGVKQAGSGGAVVGVARASDRLETLRLAYESEGFSFLVPKLLAPKAQPQN